MLMPTCLKPYPGELLYGWIVRLFRVNMYDSIEKFCAAYIPYEDRKFKTGSRSSGLPIQSGPYMLGERRIRMFPGCQEHDCGNDTAHDPVSVYDQGISGRMHGNSAPGT